MPEVDPLPLYSLEAFLPPQQPLALCLGTFDGVHLGHQQLIYETCAAAQANALIPCAFTFDTAPAALLHPGKAVKTLTPIQEKSRLMHMYGLQHVIYAHFDQSIAQLSARAFFEEILIKRLHAQHLVVGFHYHFGKRAEGDTALLTSFCQEFGIGLTVVPPVRMPDGTLVSSTAVRQALEENQYDLAKQMLGKSLNHVSPFQFGGIDHA